VVPQPPVPICTRGASVARIWPSPTIPARIRSISAAPVLISVAIVGVFIAASWS
jgi:hypothetical protein